MVMVNTHHPKAGPTYWNAMRAREVESRLDYMLLPATRLQMVTQCFVLRREGRRLQLVPHRRLAADDKSKSGAATWRSHNGSARCGGMGF